MHPLQVVVLLCTLLCRTVYSTVVQYLYFNPRMPGSKCKGSGDVTGTAKKCQLLYWTTVFFKVLYRNIKNVLFFVFVFMYYLCEKYYKPITVQYYIADCVSWVPRLTLLDLRTNWTFERTLGTELFLCRGLTVIGLESQNYSLIRGLQNGCCVNRHENNINLIVHLRQMMGDQMHCQ